MEAQGQAEKEGRGRSTLYRLVNALKESSQFIEKRTAFSEMSAVAGQIGKGRFAVLNDSLLQQSVARPKSRKFSLIELITVDE